MNISTSIPSFHNSGNGVDDDGQDCEESEQAKYHLNDCLFLQVQQRQGHHNHCEDEEGEVVGITAALISWQDTVVERITRTCVHSTKVVRDVESPRRPAHRGERPGSQEAVDAQDDQIEVLDPLVKEDLTQLHYLELPPQADLKDGVLAIVCYLLIQAHRLLGKVKVLQGLWQQMKNQHYDSHRHFTLTCALAMTSNT